MSEEVRFFVRIALYTSLITAIYWFVSYEEAGSVLLGFLAGAALFFAVVIARKIGATRGNGKGNLLLRMVSFTEPKVEAADPLALSDETFPPSSLWPLIFALAVTLLALGLLYGPWLWIPGLGLGVASGMSWLTELRS